MSERVIKQNEKEYGKLQIVAKALELASPNNERYWVEDTYLDFGQDWMWTTICGESKWGGHQVLNPREWNEIMMAESLHDLAKIVDEIRSGEYFHDR